jgi:hypothetical protein
MIGDDNESSQDSLLAGILIIAVGFAGIGPVLLLAHELLDAFMPQQLVAVKVKFWRLAVNLGIIDGFDDGNEDNSVHTYVSTSIDGTGKFVPYF